MKAPLSVREYSLITTIGLVVAGGVYLGIGFVIDESSPGLQDSYGPASEAKASNLPLVDRDQQELLDGAEELEKIITYTVETETARELIASESAGYDARLKAARALSDHLPKQDVDAILRFIRSPKPDDCRTRQWHTLFNDTVNALRHQQEAPAHLTDTLIGVYRSSDDVILKDFAIQHLRGWYSDPDPLAKTEQSAVKRPLILETIKHASQQTQYTYSGTALNCLHYIDLETKGANYLLGNDLDSRIVTAARESSTNKHCRISAIQLCAMRGLGEVLPVIREIASDSEANVSLRLSAIAALGRLGNEQDRALLEQINNNGGRLARAAEPALRNLQIEN